MNDLIKDMVARGATFQFTDEEQGNGYTRCLIKLGSREAYAVATEPAKALKLALYTIHNHPVVALCAFDQWAQGKDFGSVHGRNDYQCWLRAWELALEAPPPC